MSAANGIPEGDAPGDRPPPAPDIIQPVTARLARRIFAGRRIRPAIYFWVWRPGASGNVKVVKHVGLDVSGSKEQIEEQILRTVKQHNLTEFVMVAEATARVELDLEGGSAAYKFDIQSRPTHDAGQVLIQHEFVSRRGYGEVRLWICNVWRNSEGVVADRFAEFPIANGSVRGPFTNFIRRARERARADSET